MLKHFLIPIFLSKVCWHCKVSAFGLDISVSILITLNSMCEVTGIVSVHDNQSIDICSLPRPLMWLNFKIKTDKPSKGRMFKNLCFSDLRALKTTRIQLACLVTGNVFFLKIIYF